jgi:L-malate glycosyltransferase
MISDTEYCAIFIIFASRDLTSKGANILEIGQKMKVVHLSSEKGWRGGEQQIAYLLDELEKAGVENIVVARKDSDFHLYCRQKDFQVYGVPFRSSVDIRTALVVGSICRKHGADLVHIHSAKSHSIAVLSAVVGNKTPLILSRRVDFVPKNNFFTNWKYNHPSIKKILCVSEKICSIMREYVKSPDKCATVHSGVDLTKFSRHLSGNKLRKEFSIPEAFFLIGNSSALEAHKDYFTFIRTIAALVARNLPVRAFIMGSGSKEVELKSFASSLSLDQVITFTGFRKDIVEVLPCLDVFLMTSNEEGLGTSVLDAFLAKVVVVATAAGGIPEMVIHQESGLLAPVGDAEKLAAHIGELMSNMALREQLVRGALRKVSGFSKEKTAQQTLDHYREVLSKKV